MASSKSRGVISSSALQKAPSCRGIFNRMSARGTQYESIGEGTRKSEGEMEGERDKGEGDNGMERGKMCICVKGIWAVETESHLGEDGEVRMGDVDGRLELQPLELRACVDGFCFVLCALNANSLGRSSPMCAANGSELARSLTCSLLSPHAPYTHLLHHSLALSRF
jgi:hypothetical protein